MNMQGSIEAKLHEALVLEHLDIVNESQNHGGPGTQTHYKLTVVHLSLRAWGP